MAKRHTSNEIDTMIANETIIEKDVATEMRGSFLTYAIMTIVERALPEIRDGMKPVQRRILYSMYAQHIKPEGSYKKSARIVGDVIGKYHPHGDCMRADTKVYLANGTIKTIKELFDNQKAVQIIAIDEKTGKPVSEMAYNFKIGQYTNKVYHIKLNNGSEICCTNNHPILLNNLSWSNADKINIGDRLYSANINIYDGKKYPGIDLAYEDYYALHHVSYLENNESNEIIHHKDLNPSNNEFENLIGMSKKEHDILHGNYLIGLEKGRNTMKNDPIIKEKISIKNSYLMSEYNKHQGVHKAILIIREMLLNNIELTIENYNNIRNDDNHYNYPIIEKMINKNQIESFAELCDMAQDQKYKCIEFDKDIVYGNTEILEQENIENNKHNYGRQKFEIIKLFNILIDNKLEITKDNYEIMRVKLSKETKGKIEIKNRQYPKVETVERIFGFEKILEFYNNKFLRVVNVVIEEVDNEPMYDFTVNKYHNMLIVTNQINNMLSVTPIHNTACYGAMCNLVNNFDTRYPLVDGHGNFGSIDGDGAAAMRYTEAKLHPFAMDMLKDIESDGVEMVANFSEDEIEPEVLPAMIPYLLVNGAEGIATGYTTSIPQHNMHEICDGIIATIKNPEITIETLVKKHIKGPDLPGYGFLINDENIMSLYTTGQATLKFKGKMEVDINEENGNKQVVITELPPGVNKPKLMEKLYDRYILNKDMKVVDLRDESEGTGIRITLELHKTAIPEILIDDIYNKTSLSKTKSYILRAIVEQAPVLLNLKQMIEYYIEHRRDVIEKRSKFSLDKIENKINILKGFNIIISHIKKVTEIIINASSDEDARLKLMSAFKLNEKQAEAILDRKLRTLTKLGQEKISNELGELIAQADLLKSILTSQTSADAEIIKELKYLKKTYGDDRKTQIIEPSEKKEIKVSSNAITNSDEPMFVTLTNKNQIKVMPYTIFESLIKGKSLKEKNNIFIQGLKCTMQDTFILMLSDGNYIKCDFTTLSNNLTFLEKNQKVISIMKYLNEKTEDVIILMSKKGLVKKLFINSFKAKNLKITSVFEIGKNDEIIGTRIEKDNDDNIITLATNNGILHRFYLRGFSTTSQTAKPLGCINIDESDFIVDFDVTDGTEDSKYKAILFTNHKSGKTGMKILTLSEFAVKNRMAKGAKAITYNKKDEGTITNLVLFNNDFYMIDSNGELITQEYDDMSAADKNGKPKYITFNLATSKFLL